MTDHPIIFSAPMVLALLDGRKTMTRRLATSPLRRVAVTDRLWVRESFIKTPAGPIFAVGRDDWGAGGKIRITPGIHMPRALSRLTLTVTATRIEHLKWIGHNDLLREGVAEASANSWTAGDNIFAGSAYAAFRGLWTRLHGAAAWEENPLVVAISFDVEKRNIDA